MFLVAAAGTLSHYGGTLSHYGVWKAIRRDWGALRLSWGPSLFGPVSHKGSNCTSALTALGCHH